MIFSPFYLSRPDVERAHWRAVWKRHRLTRMIVMLSGEYRGKWPWFWLWNNVPLVRERLIELRTDGIRPVLWAANGESFRARQLNADATDIGPRAAAAPDVVDVIDRDGVTVVARLGVPINTFLTTAAGFDRRRVSRSAVHGDPLEQVWRETLPQIADLFGEAMGAPEMNDIWTPEEQHRRTQLLAELMPSTRIGAHFTRARCHGDNNRGTGPVGPPPAAWSPEPDPDNPGQLRATLPGYYKGSPFVKFCYYNVPYEHLEDQAAFVSDLGDVSVRVNGRVVVPGKHAPYAGMGRDCICGEMFAEWVLQGRVTYAHGAPWRKLALAAPGWTGIGD